MNASRNSANVAASSRWSFASLIAIAVTMLASSGWAQCTETGDIPATFQKSTDYRTIVAGAVSLTPEVGGALSFATKTLWADNSSQELFDQMVAYVNQLVPALIAQEHVRLLQQHVAGLRKVVDDYNETTDLEQKGQWLTAMLALLDELEPEFFDERAPERTLAHFVAFGTIKMLALREQYLFSAQYYGSDRDRTLHLKRLQEAVKRYGGASAGIRQRALAWRLGLVHFDNHKAHGSIGNHREQWGHTYYTHDDFCNWASDSTAFNKIQDGRRTYAERVQKVTAAYNADLDFILKPTTDWNKLVPAGAK